MTNTIDHIDKGYVLQVAHDYFIAKCDPDKQWRAVEAAEALAEQLRELSRPS